MEKEPSKIVPKDQGSQKPAVASGQQKKDYIGCLMSLISKQEIRYAGTLVAINSIDQTLVLQNVRSYGSEGRRGNGPEEIPASNQIYEKVSFKAAELKDFYVIKGPEKDFKDPAIISTEKPEEKKSEVKKVEEKKIEKKSPEEKSHEEELKPEEKPYEKYQSYEYNGPKRGRYRQRGRGRMEGKFQEHTRKDIQEKYADDFDFESMNKKIKGLFNDKEEDLLLESKYDKGKSFFDSISRSKDEKGETPYDRHKQREIDAATFDFDPEYRERRGYYPRYRRGYRGRYRRGRDQQNYRYRGQQSNYRRRGDS